MITFTEHPVFTKGEFEDLPPDKRRVMKRLVDEIKKEFER
jgi:hypothetical protein